MRYFFISILSVFLIFTGISVLGQSQSDKIQITIDLKDKPNEISPFIYGQFIEHLGRCISGGIFDEQSGLSDSSGFRTDVLEKVKRLSPPLLRYPGGTFVKIYHWKDGIGPRNNRPARPNLIWGGVEDNHFGTAEFIHYCRAIGAEPFLVANMATGSAEEAGNWVEYCNGTGNTYYANLRRSHGFQEPFNVKYWGIGNEEYAEADLGRHQNPEKYAEDLWQYAKIMKLNDPAIKLILVGEADHNWSKPVLDRTHSICDYLAVHLYASTPKNDYAGLFQMIDNFETKLISLDSLLNSYPKEVTDFNRWYRFPPRQQPIQLAIDEWGIWESGGKGAYELESTYNWNHALGVANFLNMFQRNSQRIGMATFAQLVNVLAPIMTDSTGSVCQTIFYPLEYYRKYCESGSIKSTVIAPLINNSTPMIDVASTIDQSGKSMILTIINKGLLKISAAGIKLNGGVIKSCKKLVTLTADSINAANTLEDKTKDVVHVDEKTITIDPNAVELAPSSITIIRIEVSQI